MLKRCGGNVRHSKGKPPEGVGAEGPMELSAPGAVMLRLLGAEQLP